MSRLKISLFIVLLLPLNGWGVSDAEKVIILANSKSADSIELARYYAKMRAIPEGNIIALPMPEEETIGIKAYVDTIHNPLLEELLDRRLLMGAKADGLDVYGRKWLVAGLHEISYLVPVHGVPLRISNDPDSIAPDTGKIPANFRFNRAAVDSELALLTMAGRRSMTAYSPNPFFDNKQPSALLLQTALRVSRLDGPDVRTVQSLIERTLKAEKEGLQGRAYFDLGGPHKVGNDWFRTASELAKDAYFDTTVDTNKRLLDERDRFDAPAIYFGWYTHHAYGNFRVANWTVPPGAIALHLHSFSATSVRESERYWLGPLLKMGFCATVGNVYEPYLHLTHHPHRLLERLLEGKTFGEAAVFSIPGFSWMGVAIGDPLYRPFKKKLAAQVSTSDSPYVVLREVNRIDVNGSAKTATAYLRGKFQRSPSLPLAYALSSRYADLGESKKAKDVLRLLQYINIFAKEDLVLVQKTAELMGDIGLNEEALMVYQRLIGTDYLAKPLKLSLLEGGAKAASAAGNANLASRWSQDALILKTPPPSK